MVMRSGASLGVLLSVMVLVSCDLENKTPNIFSVADDLAFGLLMKEELIGNKQEYPILDAQDYPEAYKYVNRIKTELLNSGEVSYDGAYPWEVRLINKDVVNAFATPGGYLYIYTGLINSLENEAQFAGLLAHEMAHCANRHSTSQMTKTYGMQVLLAIVLGKDTGQLTQIAADLAQGMDSLKYSRVHEYQADEYAVKYMAKGAGGQNPKGIADFFDVLKKMEGNTQRPPLFLSTHPYIEERRARILDHLQMYPEAEQGAYFPERYAKFKKSLGLN